MNITKYEIILLKPYKDIDTNKEIYKKIVYKFEINNNISWNTSMYDKDNNLISQLSYNDGCRHTKLTEKLKPLKKGIHKDDHNYYNNDAIITVTETTTLEI